MTRTLTDHGEVLSDGVGGLGVNGALGGATRNVELLPTVISDGPTRLSALAR